MDDPPAMDLFPDGGFVLLRSVWQKYAYAVADDDAVGVSLRPLGYFPLLNAVWKAEHWPVEGGRAPFLLLQSAVYGRYLAVSNVPAEPPSVGVCTFMRDYNSPNLERPFMWRPYRVNDGTGSNATVYLMNWETCLCSSGWPAVVIYGPNPVTAADDMIDINTYWSVEAIQSSRVPLPLPPRPPPQVINVSDMVLAGYPEPARLERRIWHVRATDEGHVHLDPVDWPHFSYTGRSVQLLMEEIWLRQGIFNARGIRLCVRAGLHAVPIPLVTDLPHNPDPMDIIVYNIGSPADERLVYPQLEEY